MIKNLFKVIFPLLFLVTACEDGEKVVDWDKYDPLVKKRIDKMIIDKDCYGLQEEFNVAYENDNMQRARTGDGNGELIDYIDSNLRKNDCYKK